MRPIEKVRFSRAQAMCLLVAALLIGYSLDSDSALAGGAGFGLTQLGLLALGLFTVAIAFWRRVASGYLTVLLSVALTVIVAEVVLQKLLAPRYLAPVELHERFLYTLTPGIEREFRHRDANGGHAVRYRVNQDGYRGPELGECGASYRIVVYGDSFIHAEFSELPSTFVKRLEIRLTELMDEPVEVVNAGVAGYGPDQVLRRMEAELAGLCADLLIVSIFAGNDFGDLVRSRLYRLDDSGALIENHHSVSSELRRNMALNRGEPIVKKIARDAWHRVFSVNDKPVDSGERDPLAAMDRALQQNLQEFDEFVRFDDSVVRGISSDPYNADVSFLPDSESARYKSRMMAQIIARIAETAHQHQTPVVGMAIPHPMDLNGGSHESGVVDRDRYPGYRPSTLTDLVMKSFESSDIPALNLFEVFGEFVPEDLYLRGGDDHWNDYGQDVAAQEVAVFLLNQHLFERIPYDNARATVNKNP